MQLIYLIFIIITILVFLLKENSGYRILGVFPMTEKSHFIVHNALMKGLAKRGHQVDVISYFQPKKPVKNYNQIINLGEFDADPGQRLTINFTKTLKDDLVWLIANGGNKICDKMGNAKMQQLIKNPPANPPYDIVIVEAFTANCFMGLGYVFNVPVIASHSGDGTFPWIAGAHDNFAVVPNALNNINGKMIGRQHLRNVTHFHLMLSRFQALTEKSQTYAMRKYLRPDMPGIREVEKNVVLTFINSDPLTLGLQPTVPTLVQIGGIHIEENDEILTPDFKKWMEESTYGVVYFTLGSLVMIESLPTEQMKEIYASFKKIAPMRVLMRVSNEKMLPPGLPKNVKIMPWIPQKSVLAHPNTKVFITHGGLGSVHEALYFGTPMIGIPLFDDQFNNCDMSVAKGIMIKLDFNKLSEKVLNSALEKLILDPTYKEKAVYYSKLFQDLCKKQMVKAISLVESVIRNGQSLKSSAMNFS